jgi:glyoxylase-like metal-dependent hydrolase (beta-lactamase superfamily II)
MILRTLAIAVTALFVAVAAQAQQAPQREITNIAGDLYRFQNNFHVAVFLVTPEGVIATDPIDADAARWLQAEVQSRFGVPIKYLVYSHHHADHASGGEVYGEDVIVVGHSNLPNNLAGPHAGVRAPDVTFNDRMTLTLGGKSVELIHVGPNHSDDMIVMHFPAERALFTVDFISVKRLPFRNLAGAAIPGWVDSIRAVEAMDFDILIPGHGPVGTKADATDHRRYFEALIAAVRDGMKAGKSLETLKQEVSLPQYASWGAYNDWLALNVEGIHTALSN